MNSSLYIIKPEAMGFRVDIRKSITQAGLVIVRATEMVIPPAILDMLYPGLNVDLRRATQLFMGNAKTEIGEVVREDAVNILLAICGEFVDPAACEPHTIRARYGFRQAERVGNASYYRNAIHRPKTLAEAARDLQLFAGFLALCSHASTDKQ